MPDGFFRRGYLPRESTQDNARAQCSLRKHRARKGRFYPLPRPGKPVSLVAEAGRFAAARQAGNARRGHEARTARRKDGQDRRLSSGRAKHHGADRQGGHFDQGAPPDLRHFAGRPQRRAGALFVQGVPFAEDPLGGREETPEAHRGCGAPQEFRGHHPHGGHGGQGRGHRARHPVADRPLAQDLRRDQEEYAARAADERDEPRQYDHPRFAQRLVFADRRRRRGDVQRHPQLHPPDRAREGEDRQALPGQRPYLRQLRHLEADQVALRQVRLAAPRRLLDHRTHRGDERHRRQFGQPHQGRGQPGADRHGRQPGGREGDRPPAAPARFGGHCHHRFHRPAQGAEQTGALRRDGQADVHRQGQAYGAAAHQVRADADHPPAGASRGRGGGFGRLPDLQRHGQDRAYGTAGQEDREPDIVPHARPGTQVYQAGGQPLCGCFPAEGHLVAAPPLGVEIQTPPACRRRPEPRHRRGALPRRQG